MVCRLVLPEVLVTKRSTGISSPPPFVTSQQVKRSVAQFFRSKIVIGIGRSRPSLTFRNMVQPVSLDHKLCHVRALTIRSSETGVHRLVKWVGDFEGFGIKVCVLVQVCGLAPMTV